MKANVLKVCVMISFAANKRYQMSAVADIRHGITLCNVRLVAALTLQPHFIQLGLLLVCVCV